jgi:mRNA interferase YafQ
MLEIERTNQFKKDYKLAQRRGKRLERVESVIHSLASEEPLHPRHKPHKLTGDLGGFWECHIESDHLMIYRYAVGSVVLIRLGTHSDLF